MTVESGRRERFALGAWAVVLGLATFALYARTGSLRFLFFDDDQYVTANPVVARGLTWDGVRWAFTTFSVANWHPLAWLSHMADVQLLGMHAGAQHLVNAALHALNASVLFLVLSRMTGARLLSFAVATLFAVHPLHVESVAWISERKDLLSTLFGFLFLGAWTRYAARPGPGRYVAAFALLGLSLLSKAMWITAPFLLLLLDVWPLQRVAAGWASTDPRCPASPRLPVRALLLEKIPLLGLAATFAVVAVLAQARGGAIDTLERLPLSARLGNAATSYVAYVSKTLWPSSLAAFYPLHPPGAARAVGATLLLVAVTALALRVRRSMPWAAVGWFWFLGMLVPVIGIVQVGAQSMADRYTYVPLTGLFVAALWTVDALARSRAARTASAVVGAAVVVLLAAATWREIGHWRDQVSLFTRAVEVTEDNGRAYHLLSQGLLAEGRYAEAVGPASEAVRLDPSNPRAYKNLGYALYRAGRVDEAIASLERAVALDPRYAEAHENLAIAYGRKGRTEDAMREMRLQFQLRARPPAP